MIIKFVIKRNKCKYLKSKILGDDFIEGEKKTFLLSPKRKCYEKRKGSDDLEETLNIQKGKRKKNITNFKTFLLIRSEYYF